MRLTVRIRNVLYAVRDRYSPSCLISPYNEYTGDIVPRFPWLDDNWFCLREDNGDVRVLFKDNIICGWRVAATRNIDDDRKYVCIPGKNGKQYTVSLDTSGRLSCNCTGWGYRRTCSHVKEVELAA
jgi:hypothetical protein